MARQEQPEHRPLSLIENLVYSAGELGPNAIGFIVTTWVLTLYRGNPDAGLPARVPAALFMTVFVLGRVVDMVVDPLVGYWSDRTRTRWGRRKPFLAVSALPLLFCFVMLWAPPRPEVAPINGVYLLLFSAAFFFTYTCWYGPYLALLPELTPTEHERNAVSTAQAVFKVLAMFGAQAFGLLLGKQMAAVKQGAAPGQVFLGPALAVAGACLVPLFLPLVGRGEVVRAAAVPENWSLRKSFAEALVSRPFRHFVGAFLMSWFGVQVMLAVIPYLASARLGATPAQFGVYSAALLGTALLAGAASFPLCMWAMGRRGRAWTFTVALLWFAAVVPLMAVVHSLPAALAALVLAGPAVGGFLILPHALMADVCDHDAARTGLKREAIFFGVQGFIVKGGIALAVPAADLLLETFGRTVARPGGVVACFLAASAAALIGWLCFRGFTDALHTVEGGSDG